MSARQDPTMRRKAPVSRFKARFDAIVAQLRAHPEVEVFEAQLRPPIDPSELRALESTLGRPLPDGLRAFYLSHDGAFLEWGLRGAEYRSRSIPFHFPDDDQPPCRINLLPARMVFSPGWQRDGLVNAIEEDFWPLLYGTVPDPPPLIEASILDYFDIYHFGALILGPELLVVAASDHGADLESSDFVDVDTYLDITLDLYGANRYTHALGIGWTRLSQRYQRPESPPTLEAILEALHEEED